uniref:Tudor domain-containing protein n=1 Tax=Strigamia maritima TaxID=126957 RepID=T1J8A5_STRMM
MATNQSSLRTFLDDSAQLTVKTDNAAIVKKAKTKSKNRSTDDNKTNDSRKWKIGDGCRTIYSGDGLCYGAVIKIINAEDNSCVVKFTGSGNEENVQLTSLMTASKKQKQKLKKNRKLNPEPLLDINAQFPEDHLPSSAHTSTCVPPSSSMPPPMSFIPNLPPSPPEDPDFPDEEMLAALTGGCWNSHVLELKPYNPHNGLGGCGRILKLLYAELYAEYDTRGIVVSPRLATGFHWQQQLAVVSLSLLPTTDVADDVPVPQTTAPILMESSATALAAAYRFAVAYRTDRRRGAADGVSYQPAPTEDEHRRRHIVPTRTDIFSIHIAQTKPCPAFPQSRDDCPALGVVV